MRLDFLSFLVSWDTSNLLVLNNNDDLSTQLGQDSDRFLLEVISLIESILLVTEVLIHSCVSDPVTLR